MHYNGTMKIKSYKKLKNNTYKITFFDNESSLSLYDDIILKYDLLLKKEITDKELEEIERENNKLACFYVALKYISFKNRSKEEIRKYLKQQKYNEKEIEQAIQSLERQKLINDHEYLKMYIHDQFLLTKNGPKKIEYKLIQLGFKEEEIKEELNTISKDEWKKRLQEVITKKIKTYKKESSAKIKEKILYTFLNEGYQKEDIVEILETHELPNNLTALKKEAEKLYQKYCRKYEDSSLWYQIKGRLLNKGFTSLEIDNVLEGIKKSSER